MKQTPEYILALAEAVAPLAVEISAGLLERPVPSDDAKNSVLADVCREMREVMASALPALSDALQELALCVEEDIDDAIEDIAGPVLDCVDLARKIWEMPFPLEEEKARPYLAALAESPAVQVFALLQQVMYAAIDPWALFENPEAPDIVFALSLNCKREEDHLRDLQKRCPEWDFSGLFL